MTLADRASLPPCGICGAELVAETMEVDIGVGVQSHTLGWTCPKGCPFGVAACNGCGIAEIDDAKHHPWCTEHGDTPCKL